MTWLDAPDYWLSRLVLNASFNPFHLVNTYGAFGSVTRKRYEIVVEGTDGLDTVASGWKEYEFKTIAPP